MTYPSRQAPQASDLSTLGAALVECRTCPRLVEWRQEAARVKRPAFRDWEYWARPVPGFGPADARMLLVGLAPAAHGGNRTARMFTGDRSGDALVAALYDLGLASQPTSTHRDDGLRLHGVRFTSPVHCAPPANKPTPAERDNCRPWLVRELELLHPTVRTVVALGAFAWRTVLPVLADGGWRVPRPRPAFAHGARVELPPAEGDTAPLGLHGCYHVTPRNTFTGRLTPAMLRSVLRTAAEEAGLATG
jgi:uracil-DNA glycosylase family 4